ncbi:COG4223 family protein [Aureimonas populi]|uniref:COG4223 family protein n=1 Tax=Aureimonas populi TaxID=1701758 RepID=A0ABW5CKD4_9HYPH|nr:hypothetical protein [Aureimonas populi]
MANRPRRPRSGGKPGETVAEPTEPVEAQAAAPSPEEETPAREEAPLGEPAAEVREPGAQEALPAQKEGGAVLPPPETQPASDDALVAQQAGSQAGGPRETEAEETTAEFAREEGLSGEPSRRHLGEFEDDEIVAAAAEPERVPAGASNVYHGDEASLPVSEEPPSSSSPGFGPLVGAGLLGAVLALAGSAALGYSGMFGSRPADEAVRYAAVGDVEQLSGDLSNLRETVEQLQSAQAAGGAGTSFASASDLAALSDRLAAAERTLQDGRSAEDAAGALQSADAATQAADQARQTAEAAQAAAGEATTRANEIGGRVDALDTRVSQFDTRIEAMEEANRQAGIALTAAGLKAAIDRGGPFMSELEAFASAGGGGEAVEGLRSYAAEGVPSREALLADWPQVERAIRATAAPAAGEASVGDQILSGLSSLVQVRSSGDAAAEGTGMDAVLSRMSAALRADDAAAWRAEWDTLDEAARSASSDFADRVDARRQAGTVVDEALTRATAAAGTQG